MATMRVLIVDNQPQARQSLKALVDTWYQIREIREAGNICEALHMLEKCRPQIILMDVRVADNSGLKAIRLVKEKYRPSAIIVLSMNPVMKAEALAAGADAFVNKCDAPEKLREALCTAV